MNPGAHSHLFSFGIISVIKHNEFGSNDWHSNDDSHLMLPRLKGSFFGGIVLELLKIN